MLTWECPPGSPVDRRGRKKGKAEQGQCSDTVLTILAQTHGEFWTYQNCLHGPKWPGSLHLPWSIIKCGPHGKGMILGKTAFCGRGRS